MHNHEPTDYPCVFCKIVGAIVDSDPDRLPGEVLYHTGMATAILALGRWPNNPVDICVVPNAHFENLYDLPLEYAVPLHSLTRAMALSLKGVYACDGVSTRQHNEPAGGQDVWHYHVHVTPRYYQDQFYRSSLIDFPEADRLVHARRLREYVYSHLGEIFNTEKINAKESGE